MFTGRTDAEAETPIPIDGSPPATLMAESEEELKSLLMKVKEEE